MLASLLSPFEWTLSIPIRVPNATQQSTNQLNQSQSGLSQRPVELGFSSYQQKNPGQIGRGSWESLSLQLRDYKRTAINSYTGGNWMKLAGSLLAWPHAFSKFARSSSEINPVSTSFGMNVCQNVLGQCHS